MKKLLISIVILMMTTAAFAGKPTGLNIGAGFANNFMCFPSNAGFLSDNQSFYGVFIEVGYDARLSKHSALYFGARCDVLFNDYYWGASSGTQAVAVDVSSVLHYLDIPIKYMFSTAGRTKFYFDLGPTVNFWLGACTHTRERDTFMPGTTDRHMKWFDSDNFNRVNLSLGGNVGVKFPHVKVYAGYDQGLFSFTKKDLGFSNVGQLRVGAAFVF